MKQELKVGDTYKNNGKEFVIASIWKQKGGIIDYQMFNKKTGKQGIFRLSSNSK